MIGHASRVLCKGAFDHIQKFCEPLRLQLVSKRVPRARQNALPNHDLHPPACIKQLIEAGKDPARGTEELDAVLKAVGNLHAAQFIPEGQALTPVRVIVEDDEIADALDLKLSTLVERVALSLDDLR